MLNFHKFPREGEGVVGFLLGGGAVSWRRLVDEGMEIFSMKKRRVIRFKI